MQMADDTENVLIHSSTSVPSVRYRTGTLEDMIHSVYSGGSCFNPLSVDLFKVMSTHKCFDRAHSLIHNYILKHISG